MKISDTV